jgi:hypothetical protein
MTRLTGIIFVRNMIIFSKIQLVCCAIHIWGLKNNPKKKKGLEKPDLGIESLVDFFN